MMCVLKPEGLPECQKVPFRFISTCVLLDALHTWLGFSNRPFCVRGVLHGAR